MNFGLETKFDKFIDDGRKKVLRSFTMETDNDSNISQSGSSASEISCGDGITADIIRRNPVNPRRRADSHVIRDVMGGTQKVTEHR